MLNPHYKKETKTQAQTKDDSYKPKPESELRRFAAPPPQEWQDLKKRLGIKS